MIYEINKLYHIILILALIGHIWLYYVYTPKNSELKTLNVCLIKYFTSMPCPSCGVTRSIISIINGEFKKAFELNPIGYIISVILIILPPWIIFDIINKRITFFIFYLKTVKYINNIKIAIPLFLLIIMNWIWNIIKMI